MSLAYLLDTNILIALLKGRGGPRAAERFQAAERRMATSCVTVMELEYGLAQPGSTTRHRQAVQKLLSLVEILPWDRRAAEHAGRIRAALKAQGCPIGPYDALIAGHARSAGLTVVTNNVQEFSRVPGIVVEDWLDD